MANDSKQNDLDSVSTATPSNETDRTASPRSFRPKLSLSTLLLAVAAIAVWIAYWQLEQSVAQIERQMPGLRNLARELTVVDPDQLAAVEKNNLWYGDNQCEVYIPSDGKFELCLALNEIAKDGLAPPSHRIPLKEGRSVIEFSRETNNGVSTIHVAVNGQSVVNEDQPKEWPEDTSSTGGFLISLSEQHDADEPFVLFRRIFLVHSGKQSTSFPKKPSAGILLWIQRRPEQ